MSRLERWSRRKLGDDTKTAGESDIEAVTGENHDDVLGEDVDTAQHAGDADNVSGSAVEAPAPGSLDATLPDPENLAPGSDIKAFLEPGVSSGLRRRALRRLFAGDKYGIRDGLDDYDHDYREKLKPLASELAQRMRKWTAPTDEPPVEPDEAAAANEDGSGEALSSQAQPERSEEQDEEQDESLASDESMANVESRQSNDDPMLDQGRGGSRRQSGQD